MRILLTCHVRFASAMAWYTFHLARGLIQQGHGVFLFAQRNSPLSQRAKTEGIFGDFDRRFHSSDPLEIARSARALGRAIREFEPDVLNPHCPPGHAYLAFVNKGRLPLIRTVAEPRSPKGNAMNKLIHERRTDGMIYSTGSSLPRYERVFLFQNTLQRVVPAGLDLSMFPPVDRGTFREQLAIPEHALFAAIVARMNPEKGQELLIDALAMLPEETRKQMVILLTGDDNQQRTAADLKQYARSRSVDEHLRFLPRLPDIRPLLTEIDLGIITSVRSEAVCRIALEYMAYSKPIISTDVNVLPEVVYNNVNGWVVSSTNPQELADALVSALKHRRDLPEFGKRGRDLLNAQFTLEQMTSKTLDFYREVETQHGQRK
ncbi:MAG: glycosyltransferase family 4 protein [Calditrichaeota bacterium]|nr:glycosyltransferase family 4 protein [Calditrichota bacterium]MCB9368099.1 glycosyltransferase family 4 protein [Calditrichota bacterium]